MADSKPPVLPSATEKQAPDQRAAVVREEEGRIHGALLEDRQWLQVTLDSIGDAVLATDAGGVVALLNPVAESLTGWMAREAVGRHARDILRIVDEQTREPMEDIVGRVLAESSVVSMANHTALVARDGREIPIEDSAAPICDAAGNVLGVVVVFHDVTAKRRAAQALRQSEAVLRSFFESPGVMHGIVELIGGEIIHVSCNATAAEAFGMEPEAVAGKSVRQTGATGEVLREWAALYRESRRTGKPVSAELARVDPDGKRRWVLATVSDLGNGPAGHPRLSYTALDITDRKQSEALLRESEEQFRTLANAIPQLCWTARADGWLTWYNQRWYDYTGTTPAQMEGWGWQSVHDPAVLPQVLEGWRASIANGEPFEMVFPLRGADGRFRPFLTLVMPVQDAQGGVARWFGTNTDISRQSETEETLQKQSEEIRRSHALLEAFFDASPGALCILDEEFRYVKTDRQLPSYFGLNREQIVGRSVTELAPEFLRDFGSILRQVLETGETRGAMEVRTPLSGRDGEMAYWLASFFPVPLPAGKRGVGAMAVEITEIRKAEDRLRQAQKLESIGLLAGGIAHDFNNLLTGVMGCASMLLDEAPPHQAELVRTIIACSTQASHLTRQLLAYSGKGQFVTQDIEVSAAVQEAADLVQPSISKNVRLKLELEQRLPLVNMDPAQLKQILTNLMINASEAIGENNPGVITIASSSADIRNIFADARGEEIPPGRYVTLEVSDTGTGIEPGQRSRLFDPFFTAKFTGRGLGLAAVAGIVRAQKGGITIRTAPGQGSTFRVYLPVVSESAGAVAQNPGGEAGATIMVVDDEDSVRHFIAAVLRRKGYRVLAAANGQEALDLCQGTDTVDLAVVDIVMPGMPARDLVPALNAKYPGIRILLTSGYTECEARQLCADYRGSFIQKPYTAQKLGQKLEALLARPA